MSYKSKKTVTIGSNEEESVSSGTSGGEADEVLDDEYLDDEEIEDEDE